jgi:toxin ParE1/3/4
MTAQPWRVRLGALAERDFIQIMRWTAGKFGAEQARAYRDTLLAVIRELESGPEPAGAKLREEIAPGAQTLHVARRGRRGRHLLLYRVANGRIIEIGRILHDAMDVRRHIPFDPDDPGAEP